MTTRVETRYFQVWLALIRPGLAMSARYDHVRGSDADEAVARAVDLRRVRVRRDRLAARRDRGDDMTGLRWKRDGAGRQVTADGDWAVQRDVYANVGADSEAEGFVDDGWVAIDTRTDENLDWFATMREAKAHCQAIANDIARAETENAR